MSPLPFGRVGTFSHATYSRPVSCARFTCSRSPNITRAQAPFPPVPPSRKEIEKRIEEFNKKFEHPFTSSEERRALEVSLRELKAVLRSKDNIASV